LTGGQSEDIEATCSVASRRLSSDSRRLAGSIEFSYTIPMVSEEAANTVTSAIGAMPAATLTNLINVNLPADHAYSITVTEVALPTTVIKMVTTTEEPYEPVGPEAVTTTTTEEAEGSDTEASISTASAVPMRFVGLLTSAAAMFLAVG